MRVAIANAYDNASQLTSVTNKNSINTVLSSFSYTLDMDGRRHVITEANGDTVTYTYDWESRLTNEVRTGASAYNKRFVAACGAKAMKRSA